MIYDPEGREIAEPLNDSEEGIVYAMIDTAKCALAKSALDNVGHYALGDVFKVTFDAEPRQSIYMHGVNPRAKRQFRISRTELFSAPALRSSEDLETRCSTFA